MNPIYIYIAIAIWAFIGIAIVYFARRRLGEGIPEFFIANRKVGGFISGMTYSATTYSAFMMVGLVGITYASGVAALGFELTYLMFTVFLLTIFAPRFWIAGRKYDYVTPPDLLADRYENKYVGIVATVIALIMLIPYASAQLMGAGYLFSGLTGGQIPFLVGVLIMAVFSGISVFWAGFRSVSWTDAFQALTMLVTSIVLILFVFYYFFGSPVEFFSAIATNTPDLLKVSWDIDKFIGLSLPWAFFALSNPQVSQRMFVSENVTSLKRMIIYFSIFGFIYTIITTLLGFSAANIFPGLTEPDLAMPSLLSKVPAVLGLITFVGIFAAATSTLGSIILTLSSMGVRNVANSLRPDLSERKEMLIGKSVIPLLLIVCILFASLKLDLIAVLSSMASGGLMVSVPAFVGAFFWKGGTDQGVIWSMIIGGTATGALYISGWYPLGMWPPVWGLIISVGVFVGLSKLTETPEKAEEFLEYIERRKEKSGF